MENEEKPKNYFTPDKEIVIDNPIRIEICFTGKNAKVYAIDSGFLRDALDAHLSTQDIKSASIASDISNEHS